MLTTQEIKKTLIEITYNLACIINQLSKNMMMNLKYCDKFTLINRPRNSYIVEFMLGDCLFYKVVYSLITLCTHQQKFIYLENVQEKTYAPKHIRINR